MLPVLSRCSLLLMMLASGLPASAQMIADQSALSAASQSRFAAAFQASSIEYDFDEREREIERTSFGVELASSIGHNADFFGYFSLIAKTEIENVDDNGKGFGLGGGLRGRVHQHGKMQLVASGVFAYQSESVEIGNTSLELTSYDFHLGGMAVFQATNNLRPYGGLDLVLFDDGEGEYESSNLRFDMERDDMMNIKLGVGIVLGSLTLRPELTLFGEETFTLSLGGAL